MAPDTPSKVVTEDTAAQLTPENITTGKAFVGGLPKINRKHMSKVRQKLNGALVAAQVRMMSKRPSFNMRSLTDDELNVELVKTEKFYREHYVEPVEGFLFEDGGEEVGAGFGVYTASDAAEGKFTGPVLRAFYFTEAKARRRAREMDKKPYKRTVSAGMVRRKCNLCLDPANVVEYMDAKIDPNYRRYLCDDHAKQNLTPAMVFFNEQTTQPLPESEQ